MSFELKQNRLIFVGGVPRSGTTLVQRILGAHSQVYAGPEFDLVPEIMRLRTQFLQKIDEGRISGYLDVRMANDVFERFILSIFQRKANETSAGYISEKTPGNIEVFSELQDCLPNSKYIFVIRDPRAIVASLLEVGRKMQSDSATVPMYLRNTRSAVELINNMWEKGNIARLRNENVLLVHYEDLVGNAEPTINKITNFLGIPFENNMIRIQAEKYDKTELRSAEAYWYTKDQLSMAINNKSIEKWKDSLSAHDLYIISQKLKRISGITDRYAIDVPTSIWWKIIEFAESILFKGTRVLVRVLSYFIKTNKLN